MTVVTPPYAAPCSCEGNDGDDYGFTLDTATGVWVHARCRLPKRPVFIALDLGVQLASTTTATIPDGDAQEDTMSTETPEAPPAPTTFEEAEERLAATLPGYEARPEQQRLAASIEDALASRSTILAEAGCGTGKSLGGLIPLILWAKSNRKRAVVSTATISLQSQYVNKDVPFLKANLGVDFDAQLLKGRSNYLCLNKFTNPEDDTLPLRGIEAEMEDPHFDGDFERMATRVEPEQRKMLSSTSDECPGKNSCPFGDQCFAEFAKARAATADVVIVNHALLLLDSSIRHDSDGFVSMLGNYDALLIDEGHEIEDWATRSYSFDLRESGVKKWVTEVQRFLRDHGGDPLSGTDVLSRLRYIWTEVLPKGEGLDSVMNLSFFDLNFDPWVQLIDAIRSLTKCVLELSISDMKKQARQQALARRGTSYTNKIVELCTTEDNKIVRWVEDFNASNGQTYRTVKSAPLHVGDMLYDRVWRHQPSVLVSATMSVGGSFDFIKERVGLSDADSVDVGTPFDYDTQTLMYLPPASSPSPKDRGSWLSYAPVVAQELIESAGGGALILCTSNEGMRTMDNALRTRLAAHGINVFRQGGVDGTNKEIAAKFSEDEHSVLIATRSFFTGVDFQGDTCRLVIIDKLPFSSPADVMVNARQQDFERRYGYKSSFGGLTIPAMTLTLMQGFGRLIRTKNDRGVVAILDSRLTGTGYGKKIVQSLPSKKVTSNIEDVRQFFS